MIIFDRFDRFQYYFLTVIGIAMIFFVFSDIFNEKGVGWLSVLYLMMVKEDKDLT